MKRRVFIRKFAQFSLLVCSPSLLASSFHNNVNWIHKPRLPKQVQELYPCLYNNNLVLAGALEQSTIERATMGIMDASSACYLFDLSKQVWRLGPELPVKRHHLGLITTKKGVLAIGGFAASKSNPWQVRADTFVLSNLEDHWHTSKPLPNPQAESGYVRIGDNAHVISGRGIVHGHLTDINSHVFFDGTKWQQAAPLPLARNSGACVAMSSGCLLIGGRIQQKRHQNQTRVDFYDQRTDKWFELSPTPFASSGIAAASYNNKVYVFGGEQYNYSINRAGLTTMHSKTFKQVWEYCFTSDKWQTLPISMTSTRHGLGAISTQEGIYLIGGAQRAGGELTTNTVELLQFK
ncbi:N-acetylneuraminate epimerase [Pseudoalteromonas holothuriae]|uniref:N-acetylneuraminate epimerase n=1 Tax=Pseudoalteromonas holothuriae TaxID=2963714 RepID=A0ABN8UIW6_9GAMM|nr:kelch repeat-containing protein [Pseudoalteromonas sp. CIP111951]CAH9055459.1 N-acetylneuraminate epimerase [Pseudoalteromonas sp. CIP111951]